VLGRLILPPSGLTAIVEYIHPTEAKAAFSGLAYSKVVLTVYIDLLSDGSLSGSINTA